MIDNIDFVILTAVAVLGFTLALVAHYRIDADRRRLDKLEASYDKDWLRS